MFKPARILQATSIFLLMAGCGTTQTAALAPGQLPTATSTPVQLATVTPGQSPAAPAGTDVSIKAGSSTPGAGGFLRPDGELTPDIQAYAREVSSVRHVPLTHVIDLLKTAQYNATASRLMTPGKTRIRRSWVTYRNRFVEPVRINRGVEFWAEHKTTLDRTAREYGVPPSIIVAIIGVETVYGRNTGNFRVLDALATLGFRYPDSSRPERSQLFRDQLADLIQLDYEKKLDARNVEGSFAGAMGLPQFMPGSLMRYAADGNGDGRIDLLYSVDDAIVSVARFLRMHGWQPGLPVFAPLVLPEDPQKLVVGGLYPTTDWATLQTQGAKVRPTVGNPMTNETLVASASPTDVPLSGWKSHKLGVVDLLDEPRNTAEYRAGTPNFFAITHYNRSYFYATSVADLAQALADRVGYGYPN
ncbi:lytic murein transglycosylase B [Pollutimonas nitritireducens]|uniref:Lytic murein transglycosylase B n=1 Tax=Pollutimonas nitritireducens TaxID=2045209 RepID=A0A2N4UIZ5_9BURK|nr:lytic murein transglycosylase B [Pollutimonas nitritireducens]PLC54945.1 lytic murein transglycosylase B [Pollutimonas nitritireducens]